MNILVFIIYVLVTVDGREWQIPVYEEYHTDYDSIHEASPSDEFYNSDFQDPLFVTPASTGLNPNYTDETPLLTETVYNPDRIYYTDQQNNSQDFHYFHPGYKFYQNRQIDIHINRTLYS